MDISWKQMLMGMTTIAMTAAVLRPSAFQESMNMAPTPTPAAATAPEKVVVVKQAAATQPDGYMTQEQCARVPDGMQVADLIYKYGWPDGDHAFNNFGEQFYYPIHDRRDICLVEFDDNKVTSTLYQER